jgi:D-ribose pyranose/furanose isomerase RbsD
MNDVDFMTLDGIKVKDICIKIYPGLVNITRILNAVLSSGHAKNVKNAEEIKDNHPTSNA